MRNTTSLFDLSGKTAIVTGGSRGLGMQIAEALGSHGAHLMLTARKQDQLDEARRHLAGLGIRAETMAVDTSRPEDVEAVVEAAMERLGKIDILVNNAGTSWGARAEDHPLDGWDKVFDLNVRGLFVMCQQVARRSMIPRNYGRILNIASIAGLRGNPPSSMRTAAYNASKGAVINLTRALAGEWGEYGITVNALAPGFFPSKMSEALIRQLGDDTLIGNAPLRRLGGDEDLKGPALLFCSDAGAFLTGQVLAVDGGWSAV